MNLSDIFNKINHILTEKKTDPAILEGPLFIQNTTDQINVPVLDEEKEDVIIDTPANHKKLKKKSDDEQEKTSVKEKHLIENEQIEINEKNETKISDKIKNEPSKEPVSQIEILDSNEHSIQVNDVSLNEPQPENKDDSIEEKEEPKKKKKYFFEKYLKLSEKSNQENPIPSKLPEDHVDSQLAEDHVDSQVAENLLPYQSSENKLEVTVEHENVKTIEANIPSQKDPRDGWVKIKAFFSKIKASEFYKRKDFKIGASIFMVSLIIFIGSIMTSTKPVSPETFASLAQESGLSLTDITQTFSEKTEGVISSQTAISETGWTVDFDVFTNGDIAKQNWERNVMVASQYKNDSILENQQNRNNIMTYTLTSNGYYFYVAKVNNTVLSVAALNTNREAAEIFIRKLGYVH